MLDIPIDHFEQLLISQDEISSSPSLAFDFERALRPHGEEGTVLSDIELYKIAEDYQKYLEGGFDWNCFSNIMIETYHYLLQWHHLSRDERKAKTLIVLDHFIDITDTPFLPDEYTDPVLKALLVPMVGMLEEALNPLISVSSSGEQSSPSPEKVSAFIHALENSFADGIQIQDLSTCINATFKFVGSLFFLDPAAQKQCVIHIVDTIIDGMSFPGPDFMIHPIVKRIVHPFINTFFQYLAVL